MTDQRKPNAETPKLDERERRRQEYNRLNAKMGGTLGPMSPPSREAKVKSTSETPKPETPFEAQGKQAGAMERGEFAEHIYDIFTRPAKNEPVKFVLIRSLAARDAKRDADWQRKLDLVELQNRGLVEACNRSVKRAVAAQKIGETVALREALNIVRNQVRYEHIISALLALIPSDGQSLVDKHDAEIRAEARSEIMRLISNQLEGWQKRIEAGEYAGRPTQLNAAEIRLDEGRDIKRFIEALISAQPEKPKI